MTFDNLASTGVELLRFRNALTNPRRCWLIFVTMLGALVAMPANAGQSGTPFMSTPNILVTVDNTWFHRLGLSRFTYARALRLVDLEPQLVNHVASGWTSELTTTQRSALIERQLQGKSGLVLGGGGDVQPLRYGEEPEFSIGVKPLRDDFELALLQAAIDRGLPVFTICRGTQLLNVARGGTLINIRSLPAMASAHHSYRIGHQVDLTANSALAQWVASNTINQVTSLHGQAVGLLGDNLQVVGRAPDTTIEAIEDPSLRTVRNPFGLVGVQWHPEIKTDQQQIAIFRAFSRAANLVHAADKP